MKRSPRFALVMLAVAALATELTAQTPAQQRTADRRPLSADTAFTGTRHYDVVLEVPELSVDSIGLSVANLTAHLALDAQAANLVSIQAGADVTIDSVGLTITGVDAEAYLYIDLDNVARIVNRVLVTLDRNPRIITGLLTTVDSIVGTVGTVGQTLLQPNGLLSQTVNTLGQTVLRTLDASGAIIETIVDQSGQIVSSRVVRAAGEVR